MYHFRRKFVKLRRTPHLKMESVHLRSHTRFTRATVAGLFDPGRPASHSGGSVRPRETRHCGSREARVRAQAHKLTLSIFKKGVRLNFTYVLRNLTIFKESSAPQFHKFSWLRTTDCKRTLSIFKEGLRLNFTNVRRK